jgi:hypothetical protein
LKAVVVIVDAPGTIDAPTLEPVDVGVGEAVDGEDEPHATEKPSSSATGTIRMVKKWRLFMDTVIASVLPRVCTPAHVVFLNQVAEEVAKDELRDLGAIS